MRKYLERNFMNRTPSQGPDRRSDGPIVSASSWSPTGREFFSDLPQRHLPACGRSTRAASASDAGQGAEVAARSQACLASAKDKCQKPRTCLFCLLPAPYRLLPTTFQMLRLPPHSRINTRSAARMIEENKFFERRWIEFAISAEFQRHFGRAIRFA